MFIFVTYKDPPELSTSRSRLSDDEDLSIENVLLVNPNCYVRVMLEFIRKRCRLAATTVFDLCEESGNLKNLFSYPTYAYATDKFEHKKTYFLIVLKQESEKNVTVIPQLHRENKLCTELQTKIYRLLLTGEQSNVTTTDGKVASAKTKAGKKKKE
ncbi:uncharacterized protein LOC113230414 [Hyposmocoma kahamanoa]|uniref:uncharacterized protein LOC113230414 n=1 Tax=Hyposmocoma kahamanoa TaxID=1477025 RepID=UPI000E6D8D91|nr:uncharacterized protein LOC113230414 [Hyposmocoma kahamanoa]